MSRVGWAAAGAVAVVLGVSGCGGDGADRKEEAVPANVMAAPGVEDAGPVTRAKMRVVLNRITAGVGAPPNDPDWARTEAEPRPGSLQECSVSYRAFEKAKTQDTKRTDALAAALIDRGWAKSPTEQTEKHKDGTVYMTHSVFKKLGWSLVMEEWLSTERRTLKLTAFDDECVKGATIDPSISALLPAAQ
ncbi:hypothetical protein OG599_28640 [Streptomyces sp. NBC_01335]|uniref:hypothetical protein n=1 Tax=Streptomyces sp. NBC_01335 TaxID=2903828 RepID=UPI002E15223D|nr:hypothetical protein OG599_28640 [Streptomyces sp. NBC_01335]